MNEVVDPAAAEQEADKLQEEARAHMSPPGALGLPKLLEERRIEYGLPDGYFRLQCSYDRILVAQMEPFGPRETFSKDGLIVMPGTVRERIKSQAPRGLIVSAGAVALDVLRSNGMDLGHVVTMIEWAVFRIEVERIAGKSLWVQVFRVGDVVGSEDTALALRKGKLSISFDRDSGKHFYWGAGQGDAAPVVPWMPEDV